MVPRPWLMEREERRLLTGFRRTVCFRARAFSDFMYLRCLRVDGRRSGMFKLISKVQRVVMVERCFFTQGLMKLRSTHICKARKLIAGSFGGISVGSLRPGCTLTGFPWLASGSSTVRIRFPKQALPQQALPQYVGFKAFPVGFSSSC
jgi:hypothetical protein